MGGPQNICIMPHLKEICFEREKNIPYFHQNVGNNSQISLIEAVSDFNGEGFFVPSMVNGDEHGGWSNTQAIRQQGCLFRRKIEYLRKLFEVNVCSLDYVITSK